MAVELVTGYAGKAHVSSSEDGARQAGTVGTGMYALETVDEPLKATLENANTVTVGPGDVLINGRHVQLTGSTTFAVPVGTQGMQTSNLLVLRYELAEDETESVTAITLTGEPAASDPQDPTLATGSVLDGDSPVDMPLYRVVTTGIESAQPVKLFETVPPIAGLTLGGLPGSLTSDQLPVVPVSKGGTGATSAAAARTALGLGALATLGSPLPAANGGTGKTSLQAARNAMGLGNTTGALPVANGGTGATTADAARRALKAPVVGGDATDATLYCDYDFDQRVMTRVIGPGGKFMTVAADGYFGLYNSTTQSWVWQQMMPCVKALWSGSSAGSVTLSESVAGYRAIAVSIGGTDGVVEGTTLVWSPNGKTFDINATFVVDHPANPWRALRMRLTASGTRLSCSLNLHYTGASVVTGGARLLSVVGIR